MNWKKLLLIALVTGGFAFASAPRSDAGVSIGIGFGFPVGYGYGYYPYGYYPPYPYYGYVGSSFYWRNGHRVFIPRHRVVRHHRHWR
jgi:hypothetical protein